MFLGTLWFPSLNPIGPASICAVIVAGVCWILAEWPDLHPVRRGMIVASALFLLVWLMVSAAPVVALAPFDVLSLKHRRFPDLADFLGNYTVMATGFLLALKLRKQDPFVGVLFIALFGAVIAVEVGGLVYWDLCP